MFSEVNDSAVFLWEGLFWCWLIRDDKVNTHMEFKILSPKKYTADCLLSLNMQEFAPLEKANLFNWLE